MKGLLKIYSKGKCKLCHPILHDAEPMTAGFFILRWLRRHGKTEMENIEDTLSRCHIVENYAVAETLCKGGEMLYTGSGVYLLPILAGQTPVPHLFSTPGLADETPCYVYELDLDAGSFATYGGGVHTRIPAGCVSIHGASIGTHVWERRVCCCYRVTDLPTDEQYARLWVAGRKAVGR